MSKKYLYYFSEGSKAFNGDMTAMKNTLGGKGAGLAEMTHAGMPVPQGFTVSTEACSEAAAAEFATETAGAASAAVARPGRATAEKKSRRHGTSSDRRITFP